MAKHKMILHFKLTVSGKSVDIKGILNEKLLALSFKLW